uniref:Putative product n=1 Tax=Xenopsylla cheopis TaxID=163159 RepID=A0A6M2DMF4_XENCH
MDKPGVIASDIEESVDCPTKMTLRKKIRPAPITRRVNRRVKTEPRKLSIDINDEESLKHFYTSINKNFKGSPSSCLETIFEEPHNNVDKIIYIGARKIRRALNFQSTSMLNAKVKKRKAKIKKFFGKLNNFKSVSKDQLLLKLSKLDKKEE